MEDNNIKKEGSDLSLEALIKELDSTFVSSKEREIYRTVMETVEKPLIEKVLGRTFGNQYKAAKILGINRNTLHSKIQKLGINVEKFKEY